MRNLLHRRGGRVWTEPRPPEAASCGIPVRMRFPIRSISALGEPTKRNDDYNQKFIITTMITKRAEELLYRA